jgi:hypothetical protein
MAEVLQNVNIGQAIVTWGSTGGTPVANEVPSGNVDGTNKAFQLKKTTTVVGLSVIVTSSGGTETVYSGANILSTGSPTGSQAVITAAGVVTIGTAPPVGSTVRVNYSYGSGGMILGMTKGAPEVNIASETEDLTVDQYGSTPVATVVKGTKGSIKMTLVEIPIQYYDEFSTIFKKTGVKTYDIMADTNMAVPNKPLSMKPTHAVYKSIDKISFDQCTVKADIKYKSENGQFFAADLTFTALCDSTGKLGTLTFL